MPHYAEKTDFHTKNEHLNHSANRVLRSSHLIILILSIFAILLLVLTNHLRKEQNQDTTRMDAVMDARLHITEFHLWLEEYLKGDPHLDIDMIFVHLEKGKKELEIIIDGGITSRGEHLVPTYDQVLIERQAVLLSLINTFVGIAKQRVANPMESGIGTLIDERFDRVFKKIVNAAEDIEFLLEEYEANHITQFRRIFFVILFVWVVASIVAYIVIVLMKRRNILLTDARNKAINELQKSEQRFRTSIETANDAIFFTDIETGLIIDVNTKACDLLGMEADKIIGLYQSELHPKEESDRYRAIFKHAVERGGSVEHDLLIVRNDGSRVPVEISASVMEVDGWRILHSIFRDTTTRKRVEEALRKSEIKYKSLFEHMQHGFALHEMVFDEAGTPIDYIFLDVNEAFEKQTTLKREDIIGNKVTDVLPGIENDPADWIGTYGKVVLTGNSISFENYAEPLNKWYSIVAYRPNEGQFAVLFMDITDRKKTEETLIESERQLHILSSHILTVQEKERRRLSTELHDELGQSLAFLGLQFNNIIMRLHDDQGKLKKECEETLQYLDQVNENTRRLSRDLSPAILEELGLSLAVKRLIEDFTKHYDATTSVDIDSINNHFTEDRQIIIYRIFQEILTNIVKHSQATQVSIVIRNQGDSVYFTFEDNGVGFDQAQSMVVDSGDTGIGLITLKQRLRMVNASFEISSQVGEGTKIIFTIPTDGEEAL